ncbi:translation initiation factor eIF 4e-like domain-containing protein [Kalaharituber pfeilii]|nr:translation initiation factor eIF 4e-like domain-containing protein [Kalaharituber pfeilii]
MAQAATTLSIPDEQRPLDQIPISPIVPQGEKSEGGETEAPRAETPGEQVTIFHDAENFTVKHPLMNKWTLWFTKPTSAKGGGGAENWADNLKKVVSFDSVEEFWGIYNNITKTSELAVRSDYHLFKDGIRPEWEDEQNKNGGKWAYQFKEKRNVPIDELWLHVMLAAIGETLENERDQEVMGVVVNVRKGLYRIGVWTRTIGGPLKPNPATGYPGRTAEQGRQILMEIGRRFKDVLRLPEKEMVEFSGHTESAHIGSSRARAKFVA